ncbi:pyruvate, phosphate dikinase [Nocardioides fonticola]|uniref:Pyruvate, phosphate dikinase n=1 Tax=Nocardioides fonticola TaxID=450363 RepID=A0ABP7XGF9_9ACTN
MTDRATTAAVLDLDGTLPDDLAGKELLGGKAYSVHRMRALGLPVPPAFVLPTPVCGVFHDNGRALPEEIWDDVVAAVGRLEQATGHTFGAGPSPLLVSVRSGAAQSMPGMMDTVLNLGLTAELVEVLAEQTGDRAWAEDTWRRFREGYATTVCGDEHAVPPTDPWEQLRAAIGAVFDSWTNERVRAYRARHQLGEGGGTAVTVQAMVFGNRDEQSATGVLFSRDPSTGEPTLYGEWMAQAQGEDVVAGTSTPEPLATLGERWPALGAQIAEMAARLEREHRDLVDVEFTIESGTLYLLQCRAGKRSALAAVRIAADLVAEGLIAPAEALSRVSADQVAAVREVAASGPVGDVLARGSAAGPGRASGVAVSDEDEAGALADAGTPFVLVRHATEPEDVPLMFESVAVVTEVGGATSHAALVCREIGLPCVVGVGEGTIAGLVGRLVTVDGTTGVVVEGEQAAAADDVPAAENPHLASLLALAAEHAEAGAHLRDALAVTG